VEVDGEDWNALVDQGIVTAVDVAKVAPKQPQVRQTPHTPPASCSSSSSSSTAASVKEGDEAEESREKPSLSSNLADYFPEQDAMVEAKQPAATGLPDFAMRLLCITPLEERKRNPMKRFFELRTHAVENYTDWRYRVVLWDWMKACLKGSRSDAHGRWFAITKTVSEFDVAKLYRTLIQSVEIPNIVSHGQIVREFIDLKQKNNEDVFLFFTRLDDLVDKVERINHACPAGMEITIPPWFHRWKIIEATFGLPVFRPYYDRLLMDPPDVWSRLTKDTLIQGLRIAMNNKQVLQPLRPSGGDVQANFTVSQPPMRKNYTDRSGNYTDRSVCTDYTDHTAPPPPPRRNYTDRSADRPAGRSATSPARSPSPRSLQKNYTDQRGRSRVRQCYIYAKYGRCDRLNCKFRHSGGSRSPSRGGSPSRPPRSPSRENSAQGPRPRSPVKGATHHHRAEAGAVALLLNGAREARNRSQSPSMPMCCASPSCKTPPQLGGWHTPSRAMCLRNM
jgi:hypothetical protein